MSKLSKFFIPWYGWKPDLPDHRDYYFTLPAPPTLPDVVDLKDQFPDCYNQGRLGSCTANAIAGVLEFCQRKQQEKQAATPSRLFIYYNERAIEGTILFDAGAQIRDGIKSVNSQGAPPETDWPYKITNFRKKPPRQAYKDALLREALEYRRLNNTVLTDLLQCLAQGFPFVFGFSVYDNFESPDLAKNGYVLSMPTSDMKLLGGHAVVAVGYDQTKQLFLVRNSWGKDWGNNGYFWQPFDYLTNANLASDFWVVTKVE